MRKIFALVVIFASLSAGIKVVDDDGKTLFTADINLRGKQGRTFLMYSVRNPEQVKYLIDSSADVNMADDYGATALIIATANSAPPETFRLLIDAGADVNHRADNGATALITASMLHDDPRVIRILTGAGANLYAEDSKCRTPLVAALASNVNPQIAEALIAAGVDVNRKNTQGLTPLMNAASNFRANFQTVAPLKFLLEHGADVHARDKREWTALMFATANNPNPDVTRALLEAGSDVNTGDDEGITPLMWALIGNPIPKIVKLLIDYGAEVGAKSDEGLTALDIAEMKKVGDEIMKIPKQGGINHRDKERNEN